MKEILTPSIRVSSAVGSSLSKEIIESISTGSRSPEEILARFDEYAIPWHITNEGDLMIKYWQVAAEDFVPREQVARIRQDRPAPAEVDALEWLSRHMERLKTRYGGQWVAIAGDQVFASSPTVQGLMEALQEAGVEGPFITQIPAEPIVWRSTYGRQVV